MIALFLILFVLGVLGMGVVVVNKVPKVLATPRDVVNDYFEESANRYHVSVFRWRVALKEGRYLGPFYSFLVRFLRRLQVWAMRVERRSSTLMQTVNQKNEELKLQKLKEQDPHYWDDLKVGQGTATPPPTTSTKNDIIAPSDKPGSENLGPRT